MRGWKRPTGAVRPGLVTSICSCWARTAKRSSRTRRRAPSSSSSKRTLARLASTPAARRSSAGREPRLRSTVVSLPRRPRYRTRHSSSPSSDVRPLSSSKPSACAPPRSWISCSEFIGVVKDGETAVLRKRGLGEYGRVDEARRTRAGSSVCEA